MDDELKARFLSKVVKHQSGCWGWAGAMDRGYGIIRPTKSRSIVPARRVAYALSGADIPPGYKVRATCRNRHCVNPAHLVLSRSVNAKLGWRLQQRQRTRCRNGHEWTEENTGRTKKGHRYCLACARERMRRKDVLRNRVRMQRWRARNGGRNNANATKARFRNRQWIDELKAKSVCCRCGESHVACLEFHHRNPAEKEGLISVSVAKWSLKRIQAEVAKCDIICSNCHRKLHWLERQQKESAA